ncbi:hypothetical protein RND81_09G129300 [Saponaria officinalis]|uniref:R13L1/DRL21-like LRR repeat region domain-containing protein n=1 Tax=Saponaria officinalis TaxID=3572 RepID=A0AAW1IKZ6_SAPOF
MAPLDHLTIQFSDHRAAIHETLLAGVQPQCRLSTISIEDYRGFKLSSWAESLMASLPYLVRIRLESFVCLAILPSLSQLRHLKSLELNRMSNVEFMESDCPNLKSLSGAVKHLTNLHSLIISDCSNIELENNEGVTVSPWKSLHFLSSLKLHNLHKLLNLPKEFQYLTSIEFLEIKACDNFEALPEWFNCLTSLQKMSICRCYKLKSLPQAIVHMLSLKNHDLTWNGEDLRKTCRNPDGEDWPKICHIPRVLIQLE